MTDKIKAVQAEIKALEGMGAPWAVIHEISLWKEALQREADRLARPELSCQCTGDTFRRAGAEVDKRDGRRVLVQRLKCEFCLRERTLRIVEVP